MMKSSYLLRAVSGLILFLLLLPAVDAGAVASTDVPPAGMFQLPWEQGASWVAIDGLDNGTNRVLTSSHYYLSGGAVDFAPHNDMIAGENTSNDWVTAAAAGTVIATSSCSLKIDHGNGWTTEYQYIGNLQVKVGDKVYRNERLAVVADGVRLPFCPPAPDPDTPHLHFMLRPSIRNATFAGWVVGYNPLNNATTFSKGSQSFSLFKPMLNVPLQQIVLRDALVFDVAQSGSVDAYLFEKWPLVLTETTSFTLTATAQTTGLVPLMILLDANGTEIARGTGTLSATQAAGNYFVQVEPQAGQGFYQLLIHNDGGPQGGGASVSTAVNPGNIDVGGTAAVGVVLNNVPADGYTSAEFTCAYNGSLVTASNIVAGSLFGADAVTAINGPQNGKFIIAIAGSNGNKDTTSGSAFTFGLAGQQAGQTAISCTARVSKGDSLLAAIASNPGSLTVGGGTATPTAIPSTPLPGITFTSTATATRTATPGAGGTSTATATPTATRTATPTATPAGAGTLSGKVLASKPVGISLYRADKSLAASGAANADGTFSLSAPAGTYTAVAVAAGFLNAQGTVTLGAGATATLPTISLLAGDIDNNGVIDQFDAMTIGMNYDAALPAIADLNQDGIVNVLDLEMLARNYHQTGPTAWQ